MSRIFSGTILLAISLAPVSRAAAPATLPATTTAMELLRNNCISCHNAEKHKSGLLLTSRKSALHGGENGPALIPGKSAQSRMIQNLDEAADTHMPPKKQLAADEIAALRQWIDAGAPWDELALTRSADTRPVVLHDLPAGYRPVLALALSANRNLLASGCGNQIYLHDLAKPSHPIIQTLTGPRDAVQALAWSKDGKRLAAGDYGRVLVWEIDSKQPPLLLTGLSGRVTALQFMPDGDTLIAADGGMASPGRLHLCHLKTLEVGPPIPAHTDEILALALNPDATLLATGSADKTVKLWDPVALKELAKFEGHTGHVLCAAFNSDGSQLATGATDRDVKVWDVKTHEQVMSHGPHPAAVTSLIWLPPDTKRMVVACEDGTVRLDSMDESTPGRPLPAAADVIYSVTCHGSGDKRIIYGGCHDGQIYLWSANGTMSTVSGK